MLGFTLTVTFPPARTADPCMRSFVPDKMCNQICVLIVMCCAPDNPSSPKERLRNPVILPFPYNSISEVTWFSCHSTRQLARRCQVRVPDGHTPSWALVCLRRPRKPEGMNNGSLVPGGCGGIYLNPTIQWQHCLGNLAWPGSHRTFTCVLSTSFTCSPLTFRPVWLLRSQRTTTTTA